MRIRILQLAVIAASAFASVVTVHANLVFGSLWEIGGATNGGGIQDATIANIPLTPANVTFGVNSPFNFDSRNAVDGYTIGGWLDTSGATILTGAGESSNSMNNVFIEFTGMVSVTSGQQFTVTHDEGMTLVIDGLTVVNAPGPTSPNQTIGTYTGPTGDQPFTLVYSEVDGPPAVLQLDLPLSIPEPTTTMIAGSLLLLTFGARTLRMLPRGRKG
jgi:hypothetical protein